MDKLMPRVYFYCDNQAGNLQEDVIILAEGLRALGVPFSGNCDYWREDPDSLDHLIRHDPAISPDDCDIVVVSYTWPFQIRMGSFDTIRRALPPGLFKPDRKYQTVYMDSHDGHRTVSWESDYRQFDVILRSKLNHRSWHPANMHPWVLGLNQRIIEATSGAPDFEDRNRTILLNFGASHPFAHGSRDLAARCFQPLISEVLQIDENKDDLSIEPSDPCEALMWRQTGRRFSRSYYERLKYAQAVACFCGELIPPRPFHNPECYLVGGNKAKWLRRFYDLIARMDSRAPRSVQWDSFRFWEALAAGCTVFNIDLEHYGVDLPVMPENWKHYIGVDLDRPEQTVERIRARPGLLAEVAAAGREWAFEHYSPKRMAERFLRIARP